MNARDLENTLLDRCVAVARQPGQFAANGDEANVFNLAGSVLRSRLPTEAARLRRSSADYFARHPEEEKAASDIVRSGLVVSLPRLRDRLSQKLHWNRGG